MPTVLRAVMRGEHLRRCPQWNQPRGHARRSHYATNLVSRLPPGAGPPTWRRDENNSAETGPLGPPGALQVATGFGLDNWVTDTSGGKANRVGSPEITTTCHSVRRQP